MIEILEIKVAMKRIMVKQNIPALRLYTTAAKGLKYVILFNTCNQDGWVGEIIGALNCQVIGARLT